VGAHDGEGDGDGHEGDGHRQDAGIAGPGPGDRRPEVLAKRLRDDLGRDDLDCRRGQVGCGLSLGRELVRNTSFGQNALVPRHAPTVPTTRPVSVASTWRLDAPVVMKSTTLCRSNAES